MDDNKLIEINYKQNTHKTIFKKNIFILKQKLIN